jgi:hypothetical protein
MVKGLHTLEVRYTRALLFVISLAVLTSLPSLPFAQSQSCSPSNYSKITKTQPLPVDFCAYSEAPFRNRLPDNPQNVDSVNTQHLWDILRYFYSLHPNSTDGNQVMGVIGKMPGASGSGACDGSITYCHGDSGYPTWIASSSDPLVTVDCSTVRWGCSNALTEVYPASSLPAFRIPANYRPSCDGTDWCDRNGQIIQPNGDSVLLYGCWPSRNFVGGDVLAAPSGGPCPNGLSGAHYTSVVTENGVNPGNINGGDDFVALPVKYHEVQSGQINHAITALFGCGGGGTVYPGAGAGGCADAGLPLTGIPWGSRIWLSLTHAEIDTLITNGVEPAAMRPFLYAAHDYGIYVFDIAGPQALGLYQPTLENPTQIVMNGATNPWVSWFTANGGSLAPDGIYKHSNTIDYKPLQSHLFVLSSCYAQHTCSDSINALPPPRPAAPFNLRVLTGG